MIIDNVCSEKLNKYFENLDNYITQSKAKWIKYLDLGCKTIRLIGFSDEFLSHIEKQLTYVLKDSSKNFDTTIILFKDDFKNFAKNICPEFDLKTNLSLRVKMLSSGERDLIKGLDLCIIDKNYNLHYPVLHADEKRGFLTAYNNHKNTYYYGVKNLDPEEFIKEGHIFIQFFNRILKDENLSVVHGALVGINNNGVLFCARGQRGKSTLSVLSLIRGFEYVSDDYLILQKEGATLYSYPVYSIITLSPVMYNRLYDELKDSRFVSNNARKDKYVLNIENFHDRFKTKYPVKFCMFPEIVSDKEPSIVPCSEKEKGRAIVQLIHSTVAQMQDLNDKNTIQKLFNTVKDFNFYKINLCPDIEKNTSLLKEFTKNYKEESLNVPLNERILTDITFDRANFIDTKTMTLLNMNKSLTNIYQNLLAGIKAEDILSALKKEPEMPKNIDALLNRFVKIARERGFLGCAHPQNDVVGADTQLTGPEINFNFIKEENYYFSFVEYKENETVNLINVEEN